MWRDAAPAAAAATAAAVISATNGDIIAYRGRERGEIEMDV